LRVRVRDLQNRPVSADLTPYLRGATLDLYEGGEWKTGGERRKVRDADDGRGDQWVDLKTPVPPGRLLVRQQVHATVLAGTVAHLLPDVLRVQLPEVRHDPAAGAVWMPSPPKDYIEFFAESALLPASPPRLTRPPEAPAAWLQVPKGLERVRAEAKKLVSGLGDTQLDAKVNRFQHFLMRNGFSYKADPFVPAPGVDPVEHFLNQRAGFCIHYASALTLLCRAAGVPARLATGFQLHDAEEDGSFLVRLSDAHAWAEVWFGPEHGWRAYDATPSEGRTPAPPEGLPVASLDLKKTDDGGPPKRWDHLIVEFDPDSQGETLRGTMKAVAAFLFRVLAVLFSPLSLGVSAALGLLAFLVYLSLPGAQKRRLRQLAGGFRETASVDFYRDFLWALSKRGLRKASGTTPLEFARQVKAVLPDEGVDFVTAKFYEARYGGRTPSTEDRRLIDAAIERLVKPSTP
ncbi:MAG TPA: transglutaminase domain-containing protein, partial [Planctomycetota bacterium]